MSCRQYVSHYLYYSLVEPPTKNQPGYGDCQAVATSSSQSGYRNPSQGWYLCRQGDGGCNTTTPQLSVTVAAPREHIAICTYKEEVYSEPSEQVRQ